MEVVPDETVARTRRVLLISLWVAVAAVIAGAVAVASSSVNANAARNNDNGNELKADADGDEQEEESLAIRLARENEARTRDIIRAAFVDSIDAARAIQNAQPDGATDAMRGAFLRATEELFTLERTYGRDRMMQEIGTSYTMAVRKLQAMLQ